jgi:hypothetical protein
MKNDIALHPNTVWLIKWADKMDVKYGPPKEGYDWCRKLAYSVGEAGNDHPSLEAIEVAKRWLEGIK